MITLTEKASKHIKDSLDHRGKGLGLRLGTKTYGCSGMAYIIEFTDSINDEDVVFKDKGITVVVDPKSLIYIDGTEVDFVKEGLSSGFEFKNPNAKDSCGCGESFNI